MLFPSWILFYYKMKIIYISQDFLSNRITIVKLNRFSNLYPFSRTSYLYILNILMKNILEIYLNEIISFYKFIINHERIRLYPNNNYENVSNYVKTASPSPPSNVLYSFTFHVSVSGTYLFESRPVYQGEGVSYSFALHASTT